MSSRFDEQTKVLSFKNISYRVKLHKSNYYAELIKIWDTNPLHELAKIKNKPPLKEVNEFQRSWINPKRISP